MHRRGMKHACRAAVLSVVMPAGLAQALVWGTFGNWDSQARRDTADASMRAVTDRFNAYGDFNWGSDGYIDVYYNPGVPTAQANWYGAVTFGGTWPGERVTQHEVNHWLGSVYSHNPNGPRAVALLEQFDGVGARYGNDGTHFWPYGLNYDNEWSPLNARRNVAIMYDFRRDWGIGNPANPTAWNSTNVTLTASDAANESGFNHYNKWSDNTFAHPNANYSTGAFDLRTPQGYPSWRFAGASLTVNAGGRLLYNSWGTDGTIHIKKLVLDGGTIRHDQFAQDRFQLAGDVELRGTSVIDAANGDINIKSAISGTGSLVKTGSRVLTLSAANSYAGNTTISGGVLRLTPASLVAEYSFDNVRNGTVNNEGSGGAAMSGTLAGGATIVAAGGGRTGNALSVSNGASVDINNGIVDLSNNVNWAVSAWVKTTSAGGSILTKGNGGWDDGDTIFYLGDGTAGGSGGRPSGVRYGGGFFQTAGNATPVNDGTWHQITYVNSGNGYAIYTDGVLQQLSAGNAGFATLDVSSMVRLGISTNTVAADGTLNFNGLLDNVQFYGQSLSASQVAAIFQGKRLGTLPSTTNVWIANGSRLDVNNTVQQIGSLTGPTASSVTLGTGQIIVSSAADTTFAGTISGAGGSVVKDGSGTLTLAGANSYTGATLVNAGTLVMTSAARTPIFGTGAVGADIRGGRLVLDYAGGTTPATEVLAILDAGYDQTTKFSTGRLRATTLASGHVLGWIDDGTAVRVAQTLGGDSDLSLTVDFADLVALAQNYNGTAKVWSQGDFDYNGTVNFADLVALAQNYNKSMTASQVAIVGADFAAEFALAQTLVPEPTSVLTIIASTTLTLTRRRRA